MTPSNDPQSLMLDRLYPPDPETEHVQVSVMGSATGAADNVYAFGDTGNHSGAEGTSPMEPKFGEKLKSGDIVPSSVAKIKVIGVGRSEERRVGKEC